MQFSGMLAEEYALIDIANHLQPGLNDHGISPQMPSPGRYEQPLENSYLQKKL